MKKLFIGVGVLAVIGVIVVVFFLSNLGSVITKAVEVFGSEVLQTEVSLMETEISPTSGKGTMRGLKVGNPKGFETASAMEFSEVILGLDVATLTKSTVVVNEIVIDAPQFTYELGSDGSNIDAIKRNIDTSMGSANGGSSASKPESPKSDSGDGKKLIIEKFILRDAKVNVSAVGLGGKTLTVSIPTIQLNDIGKDKGGASPGEVAKKIFDSINQEIGKAVSGLGLGKAKDVVEGVASDLKENLGEEVAGSTEALGDGAKKLGDSVKGIFGE